MPQVVVCEIPIFHQLVIYSSFTRQLLLKLKDFDFLQSSGSLKPEIDETIAHIYNLKCMLELSDEDCFRAFVELQNSVDVYFEEKRALSSQGIQKHDVSRWSHDLSALMGSCVDFVAKASQTPATDILPVHQVQGSRIVSDFEFGIDQSRDIMTYYTIGKEWYFKAFKLKSSVVNGVGNYSVSNCVKQRRICRSKNTLYWIQSLLSEREQPVLDFGTTFLIVEKFG